jgi:hypothetical protein
MFRYLAGSHRFPKSGEFGTGNAPWRGFSAARHLRRLDQSEFDQPSNGARRYVVEKPPDFCATRNRASLNVVVWLPDRRGAGDDVFSLVFDHPDVPLFD